MYRKENNNLKKEADSYSPRNGGKPRSRRSGGFKNDSAPTQELNIGESRVIVFKHNFNSFQKGIYTFQLWKKGTLTFSEKYLK